MDQTRKTTLNILDVHVDSILSNPANVNEMDQETLDRLVEEIRDIGFIDPVNLVPSHSEQGKYILLGGEHRCKAARVCGLQYVPAVIHTEDKWTDSDLFDLVSFRLNTLKGSQNPEKFIHLYDRMAKKFGPESLQDIFAVTDKGLWKKLTKNIKRDLKKAGVSDEVADEVDKAEKGSKDFEQFTKQLNKIFQSKVLGTATSMVLFVNQKNEYIMVHASEKVFSAMKELNDRAEKTGKNVNDILEPLLLDVLQLNTI